MVGWKFQPGDGYVSDDEQSVNDDDDDASTQNSVDTEFILHEEVIRTVHEHDKVGAEAVSIVSSSMSTCNDPRVPFQEIFDLALFYMERLPPRNLLRLARRYFGKEFVENLFQQAPGIFLKPPDWTTAPTAKSDLELQRRENHRAEAAGTCNIDRLECRSPRSVAAPTSFRDPLKRIAVVAAGISTRDDDQRRKRRTRLLLFGGAVAAGILAFYWSSRDRSPLPPPTSNLDANIDLDSNRTTTARHRRDDVNKARVDNGQTILAASVCWDATEKDTIDKEYMFVESVFQKEAPLVLIGKSLEVAPDSARGLQNFDRTVGETIQQMLNESLELGIMISSIIKTEAISRLVVRSKHAALYVRIVVDNVVEQVHALKAIRRFWLAVISRMSFAKVKQTLLPGDANIKSNGATRLSAQPLRNNQGVAMSDTRGVWDATTAVETSEGGLGVLFQIASNACSGNGACRKVLELPRRFSAIKKAAMAAKKSPRQAIGTVVGRMTPVVATAIDGAVLADHFKKHPATTSATSTCEEDHDEDEQHCGDGKESST
jgi:hypothetical protein